VLTVWFNCCNLQNLLKRLFTPPLVDIQVPFTHRETVAAAAARIKKRKLGAAVATSLGSCFASAVNVTNPTAADAVPAAPATPAGRLHDLELLGRAYGVPGGLLHTLDEISTPAVAPLD
jgi:hypothetical protein